MRLVDLPGNARVRLCSHVANGERPAKSVWFKNGVGMTCLEPDHGLFGDDNSAELALSEVLRRMPWLAELDLQNGQLLNLQDDGSWAHGEFHEGPRDMTVEERDAYFADGTQGET